MTIKILWPGKTRTPAIRELEAHYLKRIRTLAPCDVVATAEARGLEERAGE